MSNSTVPTKLTSKGTKKVTFYLAEGVKFATPANWKAQALQPKADAKSTLMTTNNGYEFTLFAESQVEAYDANAELKRKEALKELKAQKTELFNSFMKHEISQEAFTEADAEVTSAIVALMTA